MAIGDDLKSVFGVNSLLLAAELSPEFALEFIPLIQAICSCKLPKAFQDPHGSNSGVPDFLLVG